MSDATSLPKAGPILPPQGEKTVTTTTKPPVPTGLVTQNYKRAFTFTDNRGVAKLIKAGEQQVPQEVADHPYAQNFLVEKPPSDATTENLIPYGEPGHEVQAFENRDLGPEEPVLGQATTAAAGVEADGEEEIPAPGEKGLSTRVASGRRRSIPSD